MKMGIRKFLLCVFFLMLPLFLLGQPDPGGGGERVPITETILLLAASGIGLGVKAFSKKKKSQK
jgi:hypothetical protein